MTAARRISPGQPQLFLDDDLVEESANLTRRWHRLRKHPRNPLFSRSEGEGQVYLFGTVLREPEPGGVGETVFRMWYFAAGEGRQWIGYARSRDGLAWEKPDLASAGRANLDGESTVANNAVFSPKGWSVIDMSGVIKDPNPAAPDDERYKMIVAGKPVGSKSRTEKKYLMAVSRDGFRWDLRDTFRPESPCYPDRGCLVWDPFGEVYALYTRSKHHPPELVARGGPNYFGRAVGRGTSRDFRSWSEEWPQVMQADADDGDGTEIYGWSAFPGGGQWMALTQIHHSLPHEAYIDLSLSHSRDGVSWSRRRETVLPVGEIGDWDRFNQAAATQPLRVGDEIWVYYSGRLYRHGEYRGHAEWKPEVPRDDNGPGRVSIGLATIRLDGWCSMQAGFGGGTLTTKPLLLPEGDLWINTKADWGEIVVELVEEGASQALEVVATSTPVSADRVRLRVEWPGDGWRARSSNRAVRLRFALANARLFSWTVDRSQP